MTTSNSRQSEHPVDPFFLDRWSPRAFKEEPMPREDMLTILDAGHWAPSSGNNQPWRFIYALKGTPSWATVLNLLVPGNQRWAQSASALVIFVSRTYRISSDGERKPAYTHSFDTGAAWFSIASQAMKLGYHTQMAWKASTGKRRCGFSEYRKVFASRRPAPSARLRPAMRSRTT